MLEPKIEKKRIYLTLNQFPPLLQHLLHYNNPGKAYFVPKKLLKKKKINKTFS